MSTENNNKRFKSNLTKVSEILPVIQNDLGIEKSLKIMAIKELWPLITSFEIATYSEPSYFDRENNLVIAVKTSTLAMELSMQKISITTKLREATRDSDIRFKEVRFVRSKA